MTTILEQTEWVVTCPGSPICKAEGGVIGSYPAESMARGWADFHQCGAAERPTITGPPPLIGPALPTAGEYNSMHRKRHAIAVQIARDAARDFQPATRDLAVFRVLDGGVKTGAKILGLVR